LQEKQIAGLGKNINALAVEGSFDDCQRLVKEAFGDTDLKKRLALASANSINVARLIPQAVYYASAAGRASAGLVDPDCEATPRATGRIQSGRGQSGGCITKVFSVPSGNFGNLTAGLYAHKMGAPVDHFIAATNINKTFPDYLETGNYETRPSFATISNAMDVGAPSNFERIASHFSLEEMRNLITGISVNDDKTRRTIQEVSEKGYYLDPHSAVGWCAAQKLEQHAKNPYAADGQKAAVICTAHPAKFEAALGALSAHVQAPPSLKKVMERKIDAKIIPPGLEALKGVLL